MSKHRDIIEFISLESALFGDHAENSILKKTPLSIDIYDTSNTIYESLNNLRHEEIAKSIFNPPERHKNRKYTLFNNNDFPSDLQGNLHGNVFFAQNSIIPAVNHIDRDIQQTLVSQRKTLVMFKPHETISQSQFIYLKIYDSNDTLLTTENLNPPAYFPRIATEKGQYQDGQLQYISDTWSIDIEQEYIKPGIRFEFHYNDQTGILTNVPIAAPNQLLLNTIDIGMLTKPRNEFDFQNDPELNRQYFQTVPLSSQIVSRYEPIHLTKVVMPNGDIFTHNATGEGGGHSGNMRHQIAKDLISDGINLANYGVNSSAASSDTFLPTSQVTIHNSIGVYENGEQVHGWSGGGGKATLYDSTGNEFSHELGHNFGLSDYYGGVENGTHAPANQKNSTWLWDADNNFFIPNIHQDGTMNTDAMSSGEPFNQKYNAYTAYTPYSLAAIQNRLESLNQFNVNSKTGYQQWNAQTQQMDDAFVDITQFSIQNITAVNGEDITSEKISALLAQSLSIQIRLGNGYHSPNIYFPPASSENKNRTISINSSAQWNSELHANNQQTTITSEHKISFISDGTQWTMVAPVIVHKAPQKQGIPVITLVGFYDPEAQINAYIYPALYGSYGMTYQPDESISSSASFLEVLFEDGNTQQFFLNGFRTDDSLMNKFHINIERNLNPIAATLYVKNQAVHSRKIDVVENRLSTTINGVMP